MRISDMKVGIPVLVQKLITPNCNRILGSNFSVSLFIVLLLSLLPVILPACAVQVKDRASLERTNKGRQAPEFVLPTSNSDGTVGSISLERLLIPNGAVVVFFRGVW